MSNTKPEPMVTISLSEYNELIKRKTLNDSVLYALSNYRSNERISEALNHTQFYFFGSKNSQFCAVTISTSFDIKNFPQAEKMRPIFD